MNIGIIADGYVDANGTLDYLKIILRGLYLRDDVKLFMFFSSDNQKRLRHIPTGIRKVYELIVPYKRNTSIESFSEFKELVIVEYKVRNLKEKLKENKIDVIFPTMIDLGKDMPVKWAMELFDCQHQYFPQYFAWHTRVARNWFFQSSMKHADLIFVNSEKAKNDFSSFYKIDKEKIKLLPFCPTHRKEIVGDDIPEMPQKYGINKPFFLISNQFYWHKRHDIAFEALNILIKKGYDIKVVCTGLMNENNEYERGLKGLLNKLGIENKVMFLGVIPKKDQIELMKQSLGVIQPSEFEGDCSGQIIDAITVGQRSIASDIDVIKEVSYLDSICYFKLDDAEDLAQKMELYINTSYERPSLDELLEQENKYLHAFSNAIYSIIRELEKC